MKYLKQIWKHKEGANRVLRVAFKGSPVYDLLPIEVDILAFAASKPDLTIQKIVSHVYFSRVSLSTVKRAVVQLTIRNLISNKVNPLDRRERHLIATIND
jgi:DNA-binding MarR family transcriptional regulator